MTEAPKFRKLTAADIVDSKHPLNKSFTKFCGNNQQTKRQARKFLQKFPQYRDVEVEVK